MSESGWGGLAALGLLGLAVYSCSNNASAPSSVSGSGPAYMSPGSPFASGSAEEEEGDDAETEDQREEFDEDAAREKAEGELAGSTYMGEGSTYGCTEDCSGHEAGWSWRAQTGYQGYNPDSPSFEEGGRAFDDAVEAKVEEAREAYESGEDQ